MKKIILTLCILCCAVAGAFAKAPAQAKTPDATGFVAYMPPTPQQRAQFKKRNKQIKQLTKQYQKATSEEQKAEIKKQLAEIVSQSTDESMAWARALVAAEKANIAQWETKLQEREQNLEDIKARRVEEILSGEAQERFKLAKKRWKKEIKELKKSMR